MSGRAHRDIRRERDSGTRPDPSDGEGDDSAGETTPDQTPDSSLADLTTPADPGRFDQTFTDDDALLDLQGGFDPVAGSKQVIPRIAYTINYNFVWNAARGRWEPQKKSSPPVLESVRISLSNNQTVAASPGDATINFDTVEHDTFSTGGADLPGIKPEAAGRYYIESQAVALDGVGGGATFLEAQDQYTFDGPRVQHEFASGTERFTYRTGGVFELEEGADMKAIYTQNTGSSVLLSGNPEATHFQMFRLETGSP